MQDVQERKNRVSEDVDDVATSAKRERQTDREKGGKAFLEWLRLAGRV